MKNTNIKIKPNKLPPPELFTAGVGFGVGVGVGVGVGAGVGEGLGEGVGVDVDEPPPHELIKTLRPTATAKYVYFITLNSNIFITK